LAISSRAKHIALFGEILDEELIVFIILFTGLLSLHHVPVDNASDFGLRCVQRLILEYQVVRGSGLSAT
jgi:hypothetical protein